MVQIASSVFTTRINYTVTRGQGVLSVATERYRAGN